MLFVVFRLSTTGDISKLSHICVTILKYHSWYLSQILCYYLCIHKTIFVLYCCYLPDYFVRWPTH